MTTYSGAFGKHSRVIVSMNETQERRVFVRFADKDAKRRATKVETLAKIEAPLGKTGALRAGITRSQSRDTRGRWTAGWDVTSTAPHTLYVIKGTKPHTITGNPLLGFFWPKIGAFVVFHSVQHPGTRANNFLSRALRAAR